VCNVTIFIVVSVSRLKPTGQWLAMGNASRGSGESVKLRPNENKWRQKSTKYNILGKDRIALRRKMMKG